MEAKPQLVVHVNGVRSMCLAADGCTAERFYNETPIISSVTVTNRLVLIRGYGFGSVAHHGGFLPPAEIGSIECVLGEQGYWSDTEIKCELELSLPPGKSAVKVSLLQSTAMS